MGELDKINYLRAFTNRFVKVLKKYMSTYFRKTTQNCPPTMNLA